MKGIILSGGKGTRLRPFTYTAAKQLVPVANKPILFYALEDMQRFGISEVAIIVGDTEDQIKSAVKDGSDWDLKVTYIRQDKPRGLSHAVSCARDFVGQNKFLVILGDNFVDEDMTHVVQAFDQSADMNAVLFAIEVPDPRPFGVLETEGRFVTSHIEKPQNPSSNLIGIGYYLFDWHCFEIFDEDKQETWLKPSARGEYEITLFSNYLIQNNYPVGYHVVTGNWIDTGKMDDMLEANRIVLKKLKSSINGIVDENSILKGDVSIGSGTTIENTTIIGPVIIGQNCKIKDAYIGPFTSLHDNVELCNCEIENSMILENAIVKNVAIRIENSMIGRNAVVTNRAQRPLTLQIQLGDHSVVEIP